MSVYSEHCEGLGLCVTAEDRDILEDETELKDTIGKSPASPCLPSGLNIYANDKSRSSIARLKQAEIEEQALYELKRLELERRISKAKREAEIIELEGLVDSVAVGSDVIVGNNVSVSKRRSENISPAQPNAMEILSRLDLPKLELPSFNGDVASYWSFMRQFEAQVERRVVEDGLRLSYLVSCCQGKARRLVEGCSMLPPEQGYISAKGILAEMFGQPFTMTKALINGLAHGKCIRNSADDLMEFAIKMQNCQLALSQIGRESELNSVTNMEGIVKRLPPELQRRWVEYSSDVLDHDREPNFEDLRSFVQRRAKVANSMYSQLLGLHAGASSAAISSTSANTSISAPVMRCSLCNGPHSLESCFKFEAINVAERWKHVSKARGCFVCLERGHSAALCPKKKKCSVVGCTKTHHRLLHTEKLVSETAVIHEQQSTTNSPPTRRVCMGIVPVRLVGPERCATTYALIDNGSDSTLLDASLARELGLRGTKSTLKLRSVNAVRSLNSERVGFRLESLDRSGSALVENAFVVENLSIGAGCYPKQSELNELGHLRDVTLNKLQDARVRLLIGCDVPEVHWSLEERVGYRNQPFAKRTVLGWIVLGPLERGVSREVSSNNTSSETIVTMLSRMYDAEFRDLEDDKPSYSVEDRSAMEQVCKSIKLVGGHIEVGLPWRKNKSELPNNRPAAVHRLYQLRKRLTNDPHLHHAYGEIMRRHIECGYVVPVTQQGSSDACVPRWYLPHHAVRNAKKPGKVRVVFDCAAKYNGVCLNDYLLQGPNLTNNLVEVLVQFRENRVAMMSDIQEMFLQVKVPEEDRGVLRLLWWKDGNTSGAPAEFQMTVHPFGATSSPFCAATALRKSLDISDEPLDSRVREVIEHNFYVDDCLTSVNSIEEASDLARRLTHVVGLAGFRLTKWTSNEPAALKGLPNSELSETVINMQLEKNVSERSLGLEWNILTDQFLFPVQLPDRPVTRRGLLSCVSSLYDPLGLVAPIILPAKLLLQRLCRQNLGWDEEIPVEDVKRWVEWKGSLCKLQGLRIPRCTRPSGAVCASSPELHIFSDASEIGYGIACYARYAIEQGFECRLIMGKSRVAPLKSVSIPRLELAAATLAVKTAKLLNKLLRGDTSHTTFYTDSMTVLYYISNRTSRYSTYVANRLEIIHESTTVSQWRYVKGELNPADYASRGLRPDDSRFRAWINGPDFLSNEMINPCIPAAPKDPPGECEFKISCVYTTALVDVGQMNSILGRYSNWLQLLRAVVWLTRFKSYISIMFGKHSDIALILGNIRVIELRKATNDIVRLVQKQSLNEEYLALKSGRQVVKENLRRLSPFLSDGIMLVGGRLHHSGLGHESKHPMILPSHHAVTDLLIRHYHIAEGHAGPQHVLNVLRRNFWIIRGISNTKRVIYNCVRCRRLKATASEQMMASLPAARVLPGQYPFESTGVDYFGPLYVKQGRATVKRYGCLFTCLKTRAVHIEIAQSLSVDSFVMALNRFVNRRGSPNEIFSDNGSNFVGAETQLRSAIQNLDQSNVSDRMLARGIQWNFNPPGASHRGGVWERIIRSIKEILRSLLTEQIVNDETLVTIMSEIERVLNNRPLVPIYDDTEESIAITPNDLLILRPTAELHLNDLTNIDRYTRSWKQAKYLADQFWKRWIRSYLPTLQTRTKWLSKKRNFTPGDVVLVVSDLPRAQWPLGRITAVYPGDDGLVRKVTLKTGSGEVIRDVRKICLLEGEDEEGAENGQE